MLISSRFLLLFVFLTSFSAANPKHDFDICYKKNKNSYVKIEGVDAVALDEYYAASLPGKKPNNFVKYDPFLKLYLIKSSKKLTPVKKKNELNVIAYEWIGSASPNGVGVSKFKSFSDGYSPYDRLNSDGVKGSISTSVCCEMYGLNVGGDRFIGNRYLKHFLEYKDVYYGDVGARFGLKNGVITILHVNPFDEQRGFRAGDEVLSIDGKSITTFRQLREKILFAKKGSFLKFKVSRDGKIINTNAKVTPWNLSNSKTETFLEEIGVIFDQNLKITYISENSFASRSGLKVGDRLLQINKINVKKPNDVKKIISNPSQKEFQLLFDRNNFYFFIKVTHQ